MIRFALILSFVIFLTGCQRTTCQLEPNLCFTPSPQWIESKPSAFPPLTPDEYKRDWGKEIVIASTLASEMDLYRAISSYKRALILIPEKNLNRKRQIEFGILQCYYFGQKYCEAIDIFEKSSLKDVSSSFPAFKDLLTILYDCYLKTSQEERALRVLQIIEGKDEHLGYDLKLYDAIRRADFLSIHSLACNCADDQELHSFLISYHDQKKSVRKAETLNAFLPGAGYLYVGQKQTALTSFLINTLFIAAAYQFFDHGNIAAGIITTSFEMGWYFGGILGSGLAAKEYNERLYEQGAKCFLNQEKLFPILMLNYTF